MIPPTALAARIRDLRQRLSLTQVEVAAACGVTNYAVCRWETGRRQPTPPMLRTLAAALRVDVAELTAPGVPEAQPDDPLDLATMITTMRGMRRELKQVLDLVCDARASHRGQPSVDRYDRAIAGLRRVLGE